MTLLYTEGFEFGTTPAEVVAMGGTPITQANVAGTSTFTYGASSSGLGRSLKLALFSTVSNTSATGAYMYAAVNGFLGTSGAVGYTFSLGWRGKLNSSKLATTATCFGLGSSTFGSQFFFNITASLATLPQTVTVQVGTGTSIGTFQTPSDYNMHYYTMTGTKVGTNLWNLKVYLDAVTVLNVTGVSATIADAICVFLSYSNGTAANAQANLFSELDDIYLADTTPMGDINILGLTPNGDVQAQFTRYGGQASNWQSVSKLSPDDTTGLTGVSGNSDWYSTAALTVAGKRLAGVRVQAVGYGTSLDQIRAQARSGSTVVTGAATPMDPFNAIADTGWDTTLADTLVSNLQFGLNKV